MRCCGSDSWASPARPSPASWAAGAKPPRAGWRWCCCSISSPASSGLAVQEASLPLFRQFVDPRTADFAISHRDVIAQFGRFPHRNAALGRVSSAEELAFLQTPGSGF